MYKAKSIYTELALNTIKNYLKTGEKVKTMDVPPKELGVKAGCFVTLHNKDGSLRGCIGTILPYQENLYTEIVENAISAATKDPRFNPVTYEELDDLDLSVDVLTEPILIENLSELDPKKYGVIVSDGSYRRGVLLPDLEGVDTVEYQLSITKQKAGIYSSGYDGLEIYKFESIRHY